MNLCVFTLERDGDRPLQFSGELVAEVSTHRKGKNVWTELSLFVTDKGHYVVQSVGATDAADKVNRNSASVTHSADDLYSHLARSGDSLSAPARELLEIASETIEEIDDLLEERLSIPEQI